MNNIYEIPDHKGIMQFFKMIRIKSLNGIFVDMPWKVSAKDDPGFVLLEQILEGNLATVLFRFNRTAQSHIYLNRISEQ